MGSQRSFDRCSFDRARSSDEPDNADIDYPPDNADPFYGDVVAARMWHHDSNTRHRKEDLCPYHKSFQFTKLWKGTRTAGNMGFSGHLGRCRLGVKCGFRHDLGKTNNFVNLCSYWICAGYCAKQAVKVEDIHEGTCPNVHPPYRKGSRFSVSEIQRWREMLDQANQHQADEATLNEITKRLKAITDPPLSNKYDTRGRTDYRQPHGSKRCSYDNRWDGGSRSSSDVSSSEAGRRYAHGQHGCFGEHLQRLENKRHRSQSREYHG